MGTSYININDVQPGLIVGEDVFKNTSHPIIKRGTKLTAEHLEVLRAFDIRKLKVKERALDHPMEQDDKKTPPPNADAVPSLVPKEVNDALADHYREAVMNYKRDFIGWRAGATLDIAKIRAIIIPLLKKYDEQKKLLPSLLELSNKKDYLYHHAVAVGIYAFAISREMEIPEGQGLQLGLAGVLADCGMAKIDSTITEKAAFLTKSEFNEVKKHPIFSYQMVQGSPLLRKEMKLAIIQHHERLDGSGYPRGEKMPKVSIFSQIIAVADIFHAMASERIYRTKESPFKVIELIKEEEFGKFDIKIVQTLQDLVCKLAIGSKVRLTNGQEGVVVFIQRDARLRPIIKMTGNESIVDLTKNRHLSIEKVIL